MDRTFPFVPNRYSNDITYPVAPHAGLTSAPPVPGYTAASAISTPPAIPLTPSSILPPPAAPGADRGEGEPPPPPFVI
jgi:hypothetical protein